MSEKCVIAVNIFLLLAKIVAYAVTGSKAVLASLADSAGMSFIPISRYNIPTQDEPQSWYLLSALSKIPLCGL